MLVAMTACNKNTTTKPSEYTYSIVNSNGYLVQNFKNPVDSSVDVTVAGTLKIRKDSAFVNMVQNVNKGVYQYKFIFGGPCRWEKDQLFITYPAQLDSIYDGSEFQMGIAGYESGQIAFSYRLGYKNKQSIYVVSGLGQTQ